MHNEHKRARKDVRSARTRRNQPAPKSRHHEPDGATVVRRRRHNLEPFTDSSRTRVLRFWLNVIFLVGAVAGLAVYFKWSHHYGTLTLIVASVFKFIELTLRILKI